MPVTKDAAGKWIRVQFLDHVMGHDKPLVCEVAGHVARVSRRSFTINWWVVHDDCEATKKANSEKVATILQSTVVKWCLAGGVWR
jgi:hypothetical protein